MDTTRVHLFGIEMSLLTAWAVQWIVVSGALICLLFVSYIARQVRDHRHDDNVIVRGGRFWPALLAGLVLLSSAFMVAAYFTVAVMNGPEASNVAGVTYNPSDLADARLKMWLMFIIGGFGALGMGWYTRPKLRQTEDDQEH